LLRQKSQSRVSAQPAFEKLRQAGIQYKKEQDASKGMVSLKWSDYFANVQANQPVINANEKPAAGKYETDNTSFDKEKINADAFEQLLNTQWKQRLLYDIYVQEAFNILNDLIQLTGKPN
jgi:hypothetical protein